MTFKSAAADLPMGGCKVTSSDEANRLDNLEQVGFLA